MYKCTQILRNPYIIALIIIFVCWFLLLFTSGSLFDGYHFEDDHEIAAIHHELTVQKSNIFQIIFQWIKNDQLGGRFRPFYWMHRVVNTRLFGFNLFLFSFYNLFLASISTFCFFLFARKLGYSLENSILFSFFTTLGLQSEVWWWLGGPAEALGTFLLSLSLLFLLLSISSKRFKLLWQILFYIFVLLMSGSKESFVLIIPALAFLKTWLFHQENNISWYRSIKENSFIISLLLMTCILEILYINYFVGTDFGYAGYEGFNYLKFSKTLDSLNQNISGWLILVGLTLAVLTLNRINQRSYRDIFISFSLKTFLFLLIIIPQLLLYSKSGISHYRYLLPAILGYSVLILFLADFLHKKSRIISIIFLLIIAINIGFKFNLAWHNSYLFSNGGKSMTALLNTIETNTESQSKILIVASPISHYQWAFSIKRYLNYIADRNNLYLMAYEDKKHHDYLDPDVVKDFYHHQFLSDIKDKNEIDCIVVATGLNKRFLQDSADWFLIDNFKSYVFKAITSSNSYFRFDVYSKK